MYNVYVSGILVHRILLTTNGVNKDKVANITA